MNNTEQLRKPKPYQKKTSKGFLHSTRGLLLYILPLWLIPASILSFVYGDLILIIANVGGCAAYLFAAGLLRKGISAQVEYQHKKITQAPTWPLKTLAAIIVALTTTGISFIGANNSLFVSITFEIHSNSKAFKVKL